ncbi:hypothetical protein R3P38DRAFT_2800043 [Favolaschia claudopus]|uniref:Uncharacterized protein n=1 Tax=Favolaschia claudopus TaxID=2862362 RepID=A0AAV9ZYP7_9AGAR
MVLKPRSPGCYSQRKGFGLRCTGTVVESYPEVMPTFAIDRPVLVTSGPALSLKDFKTTALGVPSLHAGYQLYAGSINLPVYPFDPGMLHYSLPRAHGVRIHSSIVRDMVLHKDLNPEQLVKRATLILERFHLRFDDIRLLLTATGSAIVGSSILELTMPDLDIVAANLDVLTGCHKGRMIADFFILAASFAAVSVIGDQELRGFGPILTLTRSDGSMIHIIESLTDNALDAIVRFPFTCVHAAWLADGIWVAHQQLTTAAITITTPSALPIPEGFVGRLGTWRILRKYREWGFNISLNEYPFPHRCGHHLSCPATMRSSDDAGCSFYPFPEWQYTSQCAVNVATVWTMSGSGCPQGILNTADVTTNQIRWESAALRYMNSKIAPAVSKRAPDYLDDEDE